MLSVSVIYPFSIPLLPLSSLPFSLFSLPLLPLPSLPFSPFSISFLSFHLFLSLFSIFLRVLSLVSLSAVSLFLVSHSLSPFVSLSAFPSRPSSISIRALFKRKDKVHQSNLRRDSTERLTLLQFSGTPAVSKAPPPRRRSSSQKRPSPSDTSNVSPTAKARRTSQQVRRRGWSCVVCIV